MTEHADTDRSEVQRQAAQDRLNGLYDGGGAHSSVALVIRDRTDFFSAQHYLREVRRVLGALPKEDQQVVGGARLVVDAEVGVRKATDKIVDHAGRNTSYFRAQGRVLEIERELNGSGADLHRAYSETVYTHRGDPLPEG